MARRTSRVLTLFILLATLAIAPAGAASGSGSAGGDAGKVRFDLRLTDRYDNPTVVSYAVEGLGKRSGYRQEFQSYSELAGRRLWGFTTMKRRGLYRISTYTRECVAPECPPPGGRSPRESELGPRVDECTGVVRVRPGTDLKAEIRVNPYDGCRLAVGQAR